jgi:hypothetical protein
MKALPCWRKGVFLFCPLEILAVPMRISLSYSTPFETFTLALLAKRQRKRLDTSKTRPLLLAPQKDLIIYEMSVRGFTADGTSDVPEKLRGSYKGLIEKVGRVTR